MDKRGIFISVEGADGVGKSTQMDYIREYFKIKGIEAVFTREPGGTDIGEKIRELLLAVEHAEMCDRAEALLYAAARAQHVEELIMPTLDSGRWVVCDRFVDSSIAYQGYGRNLGQPVTDINEFAIGGLWPDYTIFFDLAPEEGRKRIERNIGKLDRLEVADDDFHDKVYKGYKAIESKNPNRIKTIDASGNPQEVRELLYNHLDDICAECEKTGFLPIEKGNFDGAE